MEVVKPSKDEFQTDWATAGDVSIPQTEVADVSLLCLSSSVIGDVQLYSVVIRVVRVHWSSAGHAEYVAPKIVRDPPIRDGPKFGRHRRSAECSALQHVTTRPKVGRTSANICYHFWLHICSI